MSGGRATSDGDLTVTAADFRCFGVSTKPRSGLVFEGSAGQAEAGWGHSHHTTQQAGRSVASVKQSTCAVCSVSQLI